MTEEFIKPIHIANIGKKFVYIAYNDVVESFQLSLKNSSTEKPSTGSYGLRSAQLQTIFDNFYSSTLSLYSPIHQIYFAYRFIALGTSEEKKVGTMVLSKNLDEITIDYVEDFERIFDNDINDWVTCDNFAVKILGPLIKKSDEFAERLSQWKDCGKVWRMRAVCVTFVSLAKVGEMTDLCFNICSACVKSSERFVQLGVGCLLREMSLNFSDKVVTFIEDHYKFFIREGLRYSIDKLDTQVRKRILAMGKKKKSTNQKESNVQKSQNIPINTNTVTPNPAPKSPPRMMPNEQMNVPHPYPIPMPIQGMYMNVPAYGQNNMYAFMTNDPSIQGMIPNSMPMNRMNIQQNPQMTQSNNKEMK